MDAFTREQHTTRLFRRLVLSRAEEAQQHNLAPYMILSDMALKAVAEARPAYAALGGTLDIFESVFTHGFTRPSRERAVAFFCRTLVGAAAPEAGAAGGRGCDNVSEIVTAILQDVSKSHLKASRGLAWSI